MTAPMTEAEIREALARAERAYDELMRVTGMGKYAKRVQGGPPNPPRCSIPARPDYDTDLLIGESLEDSKRLAADLLAARAERDLALSLRNTATNVLADVVAHRDSLAARCRELEGFVRGFLHASSGTRNENAAALLSRLETRAQVLLSPPTPHTCQIHRATSGASDCGLEPCEEATVHRDRGEARPATVRRVQATPSPEAPPVEDIVATIAATVPGEHVASLHGSQEIKGVPNRWAWSCRCGARSKRADMTIAEAKASHRAHVMSATPAETATPEDAKCATCGHEERRHLSEDGDGARWCDVALCDCVDYAALEVNRG